MSDLPFTKDILRVAARATGHGRMEAPDGSATVRSPTCGDRITVDVSLDDGRINSISHEARACVLCQASATILAEAIGGRSAADVGSLLDDIRSMLKDDGPAPPVPFDAYELLKPAAAHKNRHRCITLPLEATMEALESVGVPDAR